MSEEQIKIIIKNNKQCKLETKNSQVISAIGRLLSYQQVGYEYTPAHINYGWNGMIFLMNKKNEFYSGNLSKVKQYLSDNNYAFLIEDLRIKTSQTIPLDISGKLNQLSLIPRDYQEKIVKTAIATDKGIIRSCTGSGKSICAALITAQLNKPTIIYVIGLDLLKQFHDLFSSLFDEKIGYIGNGIVDIQRINIASVWTIGRALDNKDIYVDDEGLKKETYDETHKEKIIKLLQNTKVHQFDECHVITTDTIRSIIKIINPEHIYGFSGTPFRDDGSDLLSTGILGEQIINVPASELIEKGVLAQPLIKFLSVPPMKNMSKEPYQTVYKEYIVENNYRNELILQNAKNLIEKNYKVLVLFKQIKHGEILADKFIKAGIKFEILNGNDDLDKRSLAKEKLTNGEIDCVLASTIFDIGIDLPILSALVLAGGGKSNIKGLQRIGRVIRPFKGKSHVAIVDFYDQVRYLKNHSLARLLLYNTEIGFKIIPNAKMGHG